MTEAAEPERGRWWAGALAGVVAGCALLSTWTQPGPAGLAPTLTAVIGAAYLVVFVFVSRHAARDSRAGLALLVVTVVVAGGLTAVAPSNAAFQFWAYPLLWTLVVRKRHAVGWSSVTAAAVYVGYGIGSRDDGWLIGLFIQAGSLAVSVAMGLWISRIAEVGEERARLVEQLTAAQGELEVLHRTAGAVSERERLSRELHDTIAQSLTGTVLLLQRARADLATDRLTDGALAVIEDAGRAALAETRALVAATAQIELGAGLEDALATVVARFERESGVRVATRVDIAAPMPRESEVVLLRCVQEALANVRKHADAAAVDLELAVTSDEAVLRVIDDGRGFDPDQAVGYGLAGLRQRLEAVGGRLDVDGAARRATLAARIPVDGAA